MAKVLFTEAYAALSRQFAAIRGGPKPLTHKQAVALAGEATADESSRSRAIPPTPEAMEAARARIDVDVADRANGPET